MATSEPRESGADFDRRSDLLEQRSICLRALRATTDARVISSVSKELREVNRELDGLPDPVKVTKLDDARAEYARLVAVADLPSSAAGTG